MPKLKNIAKGINNDFLSLRNNAHVAIIITEDKNVPELTEHKKIPNIEKELV